MAAKRKYYVHSSVKYKGQVRISTRYNQLWRGFTLQRGHFFGETLEGQYWVSGLQRGQGGTVKVYFCDVNSDEYHWSFDYLPRDHPLVKQIFEAIPRRKAMGIENVEWEPLHKQKVNFPDRLTTQQPTHYKSMYIRQISVPWEHKK